MTPAISLVAWEDRSPDFIFVAVPDHRGRYLRTDKSVAFMACPVCHSIKGEPCNGSSSNYTGTTHYMRRKHVLRQWWGHRFDDVLDVPPSVPDEWMEPSS
jgi:hypothetical protein